MLEATPSLALLSLLKMALAGEHSSYKGDFFEKIFLINSELRTYKGHSYPI